VADQKKVKKESLFSQLYEGAKDSLKNLQKPLVENQLKRKFHSAYDDAAQQIFDTKFKQDEARSTLKEYNINKILELKQKEAGLVRSQEAVVEEYLNMFGVEMDVKV